MAGESITQAESALLFKDFLSNNTQALFGRINTIAEKNSVSSGSVIASAKDKCGSNFGHYAACNGDIQETVLLFVRLLGEFSAEERSLRTAVVADGDQDGNSPLLKAVLHGHGNMTNLLLFNGATIKTRNNYSENALHLALRSGDSDTVKQVVESATNAYAVRRNTVAGDESDAPGETLRTFVNQANNLGQTPIHYAARVGRVDIVNHLLSTGLINVHATDGIGKTAASVAADAGNVDAAELL